MTEPLEKARLRSLVTLAATIGTVIAAIRENDNRARKLLYTVAAIVLVIRAWWTNSTITEAAWRGDQMTQSIKLAQHYGNDVDLVAPTMDMLTEDDSDTATDSDDETAPAIRIIPICNGNIDETAE